MAARGAPPKKVEAWATQYQKAPKGDDAMPCHAGRTRACAIARALARARRAAVRTHAPAHRAPSRARTGALASSVERWCPART